MGEVYRAKDTRLDRTVAIKVLPQHLSDKPELKQRLEREAKSVSNLSHPNICTLYDVGEQDGTAFLVLEFLEGETLEQRLEKGPLPAEQVLRVAIEITDALEKAHKQGIIHRDLKPANVMLTKSGAKLMDFGLAKLTDEPVPVAAALSELTAENRKLTAEGTIMGTFQYMPPEQLEGREVDARTDLFALGMVIYEMATGKPAFTGRTKASLIASILTAEPPAISTLQPMTPPALDRVVKICLAKDPDERFQTAHDLNLQLHWILEGGSQAGVAAPVVAHRKHREWTAWGAAAALLLAAAAAGAGYWKLATAPVPVYRASIVAPEKTHFNLMSGGGPVVISPDGRQIVFGATTPEGLNQLWVQSLDSLVARPLAGTESSSYPFWSPDGRFIGFFAGNKLKKIEASGGPPQSLCDVSEGRGGSWSQEGVIIYGVRDGPLFKVSAAGGAATQLTKFDASRREGTHRWPWFLPDGRRFLYMAGPTGNDNQANTIFLGSLDSDDKRLVVNASSSPQYASGYLLFRREASLMAQPFDPKRGQTTGDAFPITDQVRFDAGVSRGIFSASDNGILVYQTGTTQSGSQMLWLDRTGKNLGMVGTVGLNYTLRVAPDAQRLAVSAFDTGSSNLDVWVYEVARGIKTRFTFDAARDLFPTWSPDGTQVAFSSEREGKRRLFVKRADGSAPEELLLDSLAQDSPTDWSPDGKYLAFWHRESQTKTGYDIWILPMTGERKPYPFLQGEFNESEAVFSPDGHWMAYISDESGRTEVYVAPFPGPGGKWQASTAGGRTPRWRKDGRELYYLAPDDKMMAVDVGEKGAGLQLGIAHPLFQAHVPPLAAMYDVSRDGRFLLNSIGEDKTATPLTLVVNWTAELKKK
jgi:Tol biopolymer transport system component/tRNA A-37 threonylcarbamoyl transferase component Bud32